MQKTSIKSVLFVLLVAASIASFAFLQSMKMTNAKTALQPSIENVEDIEPTTDVPLPEAEILQRLLEKGRQFIPATSF